MDYILDHRHISVVAGAGASGGTLVDVLLANTIRDSRARPRD